MNIIRILILSISIAIIACSSEKEQPAPKGNNPGKKPLQKNSAIAGKWRLKAISGMWLQGIFLSKYLAKDKNKVIFQFTTNKVRIEVAKNADKGREALEYLGFYNLSTASDTFSYDYSIKNTDSIYIKFNKKNLGHAFHIYSNKLTIGQIPNADGPQGIFEAVK